MKRGVFGLLFIFFSFSLVMSFGLKDFTILNETILDEYNQGDLVSGWMNVSVQNLPSLAILESNLGGNISILEFLILNNLELPCMIYNCTGSYESSNDGYRSKDVFLPSDNVIGFKIEGRDEVEIESISFDISSNFSESNEIPLIIEFFNNYNWSWEEPSQNYTRFNSSGCYYSKASQTRAKVQSVPYCEYIENLPSSKAYQVGAQLEGSGSEEMSMFLQGDSVPVGGEASCYFDALDNDSCLIELTDSLPKGDYLVCISSVTGDGSYSLSAENYGNNCGYYDSHQSSNDYSIFIKVPFYASSQDLVISKSVFDDFLITNLNYYLGNRYPSENFPNQKGDCSFNCVFPIKLFGVDQKVTISNFSVEFNSNSGSYEENDIYDLFLVPELIDFEGVLDFSLATFQLNKTGIKDLSFDLDGKEIFKKAVVVHPAPQINSLTPLNFPAGVETEFIVNYHHNLNVSKFEWSFGDGQVKTTDKNKVSHTYLNKTKYNLTVYLTDTKGITSKKSFEILVGDSKEVVNKTLSEKVKFLKNFLDNLDNFSEWKQEYIKEILDVPGIVNNLDYLEELRKSAVSDEDYISLAIELQKVVIPLFVFDLGITQGPFLIDSSDIDVTPLRDLSSSLGKGSDSDYQTSISEWQRLNTQGKFVSKKYGVTGDDGKNLFLMQVYSLDVTSTAEEDSFIIVNKPSSKLNTEKFNPVGAFGFLKLSAGEKKVLEFAYSTEEEPLIYIAPDISILSYELPVDVCNFNTICEKKLGENYHNCRGDCKPLVFSVMWLILLLGGGLVLYTLIQMWYTYNYENKLFDDSAQLFNLVNYIDNMKYRKALEHEVRTSLSKKGWSQERITYAIKKSQGRNTGMYELIPIQKIIAANRRSKAKKNVKNFPDSIPLPPQGPGFDFSGMIGRNLPPRTTLDNPKKPFRSGTQRFQNTNLNKPGDFRQFRGN